MWTLGLSLHQNTRTNASLILTGLSERHEGGAPRSSCLCLWVFCSLSSACRIHTWLTVQTECIIRFRPELCLFCSRMFTSRTLTRGAAHGLLEGLSSVGYNAVHWDVSLTPTDNRPDHYKLHKVIEESNRSPRHLMDPAGLYRSRCIRFLQTCSGFLRLQCRSEALR